MIKLQIVGNLGGDCIVKEVNGKNVKLRLLDRQDSHFPIPYKRKDGIRRRCA
jgi:hypothetical protein